MKTFQEYVESLSNIAGTDLGRTLQDLSIKTTKLKQTLQSSGQSTEQADKALGFIKQIYAAANSGDMDKAHSMAKQLGNFLNYKNPQLKGLNPHTAKILENLPLLSHAVSYIGKHQDVAGPLVDMLNKQRPEKLQDWENQFKDGRLDVAQLKRKLVTHGYYNPLSYPRSSNNGLGASS